MQKTLRSGQNWRELSDGIHIFGHEGEIRPEGEEVMGLKRPKHWLLRTPNDLVAVPPYDVANSVFAEAKVEVAVVVNPVTAVTLFLDNGFQFEDLRLADESNGYIAMRVIRHKLNLMLVISDGTGTGWVSKDGKHIFRPTRRPEAITANPPTQPRWMVLG